MKPKETPHGLSLADAAFPRGVFSFRSAYRLALLVRYAHVAIPVVSNYTFETLLVGFLLLLAGNMIKGF